MIKLFNLWKTKDCGWGGGEGGERGGVLQQRNFWSEVRAFFMLGSFICEDKVIFIHIFLLLFFFF